jgi:hypothetical protein
VSSRLRPFCPLDHSAAATSAPASPPSAQAAFGSFATLLGVQISDRRLFGIGDSLAVLDDGTALRASFPYERPVQFRANHLLFSSIDERNQSVLGRSFSIDWSFEGLNAPKLFCMTDAIGAWLLTAPEERSERLRSLKSRSDFVALVEAAPMQRDDTSLDSPCQPGVVHTWPTSGRRARARRPTRRPRSQTPQFETAPDRGLVSQSPHRDGKCRFVALSSRRIRAVQFKLVGTFS